MKVYVITDGNYSDYHIEAVTTDEHQAELYIATKMDKYKNSYYDDYHRIEVFDTDDIHIEGNIYYALTYYIEDKGDYISNLIMSLTPFEFDEEETPNGDTKYIIPVTRRYDIHGKDKELALKVARDYLSEYLYNHHMVKHTNVSKYMTEMGYFKDGKFYYDKKYTKEIVPELNTFCVDRDTHNLYVFTNDNCQMIIKNDEDLSLDEFYGKLLNTPNTIDAYLVELRVKHHEEDEYMRVRDIIIVSDTTGKPKYFAPYYWATNHHEGYEIVKVVKYESIQSITIDSL